MQAYSLLIFRRFMNGESIDRLAQDLDVRREHIEGYIREAARYWERKYLSSPTAVHRTRPLFDTTTVEAPIG